MIDLAASHNGRIALSVVQSLYGKMRGVQARAARGVDGDGGAAEIEMERDSICYHGGCVRERTRSVCVGLLGC